MSSSQFFPPPTAAAIPEPPALIQPFFAQPAPPSSSSSHPPPGPPSSTKNGGQPSLSLGSLPQPNGGQQTNGFRGLHQLTGAPTPPCPVGERQISGSSSSSAAQSNPYQQSQQTSNHQLHPQPHPHQNGRHQPPSFSSSSSSDSSSQLTNQNQHPPQQPDRNNNHPSSSFTSTYPSANDNSSSMTKGTVGNGPGLGIQSSLSTVGSSASVGGGPKDVPDGVFEFTKRKKWSQLLIHELSDTVVFVLLPLSNGGAKIIYTSPGVEKLLGYKARDIENKPLSEIVHEPDLPPLLSYLHQSILNRTDLSSFHRFLPKFDLSSANGNGKDAANANSSPSLSPNLQGAGGYSSESSQSEGGGGGYPGTGAVGSGTTGRSRKPSFVGAGAGGANGAGKADAKGRPVLMELRGHGYWGEEVERGPLPLSLTQGNPSIPIPGSGGNASHPSGGGSNERCKCFFLMAKRWPSRAGDMLDGFLEEKIENERLRVELMEMLGTDSISDSELDLHLNSSTSATAERIPSIPHNHHPNPTPHLHQSSFTAANGGSNGGTVLANNPLLRPQHLLSQSFSFSSSSYGDDQPGGGAYEDDDSDDNVIPPPPPPPPAPYQQLHQPSFSSFTPHFSSNPMTSSHARSHSSSSASSSSSPPNNDISYNPMPSARSRPPVQNDGSSSANSPYLPPAPPKPPKASKPKAARPSTVVSVGDDGGPPLKKAKKAKKSAKEDGNHVCVTCGRTDSPEWRKGPLGPKTLCNACGLRYSKSQKDKDGTGGPAAGGGGGGGANAAASSAPGMKKK